MSSDTAIGLNLSDRCSVAGVNEKERQTRQYQSAVVGAVLKFLEDGGPLTGDIHGASTVGTGLSWPPESRITESDETRRIPVPVAWAALDRDALDSIPEMTAGLAAVAQILLKDVDPSASCALVVPNTLSGRGRRSLLQRFTGGWQPRLLWRPVAATLAWIECFGLSNRQAKGDDDSCGHVLALHLGLDALETTRVEIRRFKHGRRKLFLPARRLPKQKGPEASHTFLAPCCWPEQVALRLSDDNLSKAWNLMWCSPWLEQQNDHATNGFHPEQRLDSLRTHTASLVQRRIVPDGPADRQPLPVSGLQSLRMRMTRSPNEQEAEIFAWAEQTRTLARESNHIGTVITGSLSNVLAQESRLNPILHSLGIPELDRLVANSEIEPLSRGSAVFAKRIAEGEPGYLDTLPKIETLITRRGEPMWLDLTAQDGKSDIDRFVIAGKRFDEVVPDQGLGVAKGEKHLHLTLWKEDEEYVKETNIDLPGSVMEATPVQLRVLMDPGQGTPRLLVVPEDPNAFGGRAVEIDWEDRPFTSKTKEQALAEIPRTNPPTEPRLASLDAWQGRDFFFGGGGNTQETEFPNAKSALESFLETPHRSRAAVASALGEIRGLLRSNDQTFLERIVPSHATAFSSDGKIARGARDPAIAVDFQDQLAKIIESNESGPLRSDALRCAGYCSLRAPSIQRGLVNSLRSKVLPSAEELICIGNTFKTNRECRMFLGFIGEHLSALNNNTMKAMARILQYREDALEDVESSTCAILADACREVLEQEVRAGKAKYRFRHASLCIVYLLRRRRYDDHFMNPNAELATDIKKLFERTIEKFRRGRMDVVGGFVDLPRITQTLIDYIDRRGRGRLTSLID